MRRIACAVVALGVVILGGSQLFAHHAFSAEFDAKQPIVLKGAVSKEEWINPHAWVYIDVKDDAGKITTWAIECGAPNALLRRGWNRKDLPIGTEIVVDGYRAKDGSSTMNAANMTFPDGRKLFIGSTGTGAPSDTATPK
jgi:hypothetical protein